MKKNGFFYTGFNYLQRKFGRFKLGESGQERLNDRLSTIRRKEGGFQCLGYLILKRVTKAERLFVESYARMMMERLPELTNVQNDHFIYDIKKGHKYEQVYFFSNKALSYAMKACEMAGIQYEIGTQTFPKKNWH